MLSTSVRAAELARARPRDGMAEGICMQASAPKSWIVGTQIAKWTHMVTFMYDLDFSIVDVTVHGTHCNMHVAPTRDARMLCE